jgi:plasmid replication initiation protein
MAKKWIALQKKGKTSKPKEIVLEVQDIKDEYSLIAVSNELLVRAQWPKLKKDEQSILIYALSLIEKDDDDFKTYLIPIKSLSILLDTKRKDVYEKFDTAIDGLMTKIIRFFDAEMSENVKTSFCASVRESREKGYVKLRFSPELKPFLLALKGNFTSWERRAVIRISFFYAFRTYMLIKFHQGQGRNVFDVNLDWFRMEFLGVTQKGYENYYNFKIRILEPIQREINKVTDVQFSFKVKKRKGKKVESLELTFKRNPNYSQLGLPFNEELPERKDEIAIRLENLQFDGISRLRNIYSDDVLLAALDDVEHEAQRQKKLGKKLTNPAGWLNSRLPEPGKAYEYSAPYKQFLDEQKTKKEALERRSEETRKQAEAREREERERGLFEKRIEDKIKEIGADEWEKLKAECRKTAETLIKKPRISIQAKQEAAQKKFLELPDSERKAIEKEALEEIKKALSDFNQDISETSKAFINALENKKLLIIESRYDLQLEDTKTHKGNIEKRAEKEARQLLIQRHNLLESPILK